MTTTSRAGGPATPSDPPEPATAQADAQVTAAAAGGAGNTSDAPPPASASGDRLDGALLKVAGVVVLGAIMSILDVTVVNVAINDLAREFGTTLSTIQWVSTGYTLA